MLTSKSLVIVFGIIKTENNMKKNKWKVEIRTTCKVCGKALPNARFRTFCSAKCRTGTYNKKQIASGYSKRYQRARNDAIASVPDPDKCQCLICGKWYVQVCSHVFHRHGMTGREYREYFKLEVKKGVVPDWYRKIKGDQAIDNETYKNLVAGAKFRFKKGQKGCGVYERSPITIEKLRQNVKKTRVKK